MERSHYIMTVAIIVALGGFLMGFDASVINGVNKFIEVEFGLSKLELGWAVSSLTLTAAIAMLLTGPISDRIGRRKVLTIAAVIYFISAMGSALAPNFTVFVFARMLGGFGVGASLIIAPIYIAEIAPPEKRGRLVSFNQLNIVLGISAAFFTNYLILQWSNSGADWVQNLGIDENNWRWMLGLEAVPAVLYFFALFFVPKSPRWLAMKGRYDEALIVMKKATNEARAISILEAVKESLNSEDGRKKLNITDLFSPALRVVLTIGIVIGILQQITGINAVFFYATMIFEQTGIGTDASFIQAIFVGLVNLVFTILAILLIDRLGRKPLLIFGVSGIVITMFILSFGFNQATYTLTPDSVQNISAEVDNQRLAPLIGMTFDSDVTFKRAVRSALGSEKAIEIEGDLLKAATTINAWLILIGILAFVASFAISVGPVMWVLFSELFPNWIRGLAISFVGLLNSLVSFGVQWVFPWELDNLGSSTTFLIYGVFALLGLVFILFKVPETKGKSLEELEKILVK